MAGVEGGSWRGKPILGMANELWPNSGGEQVPELPHSPPLPLETTVGKGARDL